MINEFKEKLIYIIDDEYEIVQILNDIIKAHVNIKIKKFNSPIQALEDLSGGEIPNLILVDIKMPRMNGLEFIQQVNKLKISKPIIVISGHADKADAVECLKLGAYHLLDKPVSIEILIHTVLQALTLEEICLVNEKLTEEKEVLINLFKKFLSTSEERIFEIENLVLDRTELLQKDKVLLKNFLDKINECNKIDREIIKSYKGISALMQRQSSMLQKNISQEFLDSKVIQLKKPSY